MTTLLLIHGGLWEGMNAARFWHTPGIVDSLQHRGFDVLTPDRLAQPSSWDAEARHLLAALPDRPVTLVAGSNGCSVAVRLALASPDRVTRLILAWPATACDTEVDDRTRRSLVAQGAAPQAVDELLTGQTLRGLTDDEIASLQAPTGVLPSVPDNLVHQRRTVDALLALVPGAQELPGCREPLHPEFSRQRATFLDSVTAFAG